jgi:AraC family transcriptional regulator, transcriptional activator of pobA
MKLYKNKDKTIPTYTLDNFRSVHRLENDSSSFGYNAIDKSRIINGFELYSSEGLVCSVGPLKSEFYRISIMVSGTLDMRIGLEYYLH